MSLKEDLQKVVASATDLIAELPATQQRRMLEIAFDKVDAALAGLPDDATMEDVKETAPETDPETVPEDPDSKLEPTTPFSEADQEKIF